MPKGPVDPPPVVRLQISRSLSRLPNSQQGQHKPPTTANSDVSSLSSEGGAALSSKQNQDSKLTSASLIQSPYLFCFAALCKAEEDEELYLLADGKTRYVTGNVVSSLYHLKDPRDGSAEGFFVFPGESSVSVLTSSQLCTDNKAWSSDIGVRVEGTFRLKLSLYEMVEYVRTMLLKTAAMLTHLLPISAQLSTTARPSIPNRSKFTHLSASLVSKVDMDL